MREEFKADHSFPPLYSARVEDLREWHVVVAQCNACRHEGTVPPTRLTRRFAGHERLLNVRRFLKCTACGNRVLNMISVRRMPR
ncbi:MAG: hypothetical protein ACM30I_10610 [Gemmatimonas sp.]